MTASTGKKGGKKINRMSRSPSHNLYNSQARWITNRIRRIKRHLKRQPNDKCAQKALEA